MRPLLHQFLDTCSLRLEKGAIQGHQEAMLRTFHEATVHIPDHFQPCGWKLIRADYMSQSRFILGDVCVLAAAEGGDGAPLFKWGKSWKELYVPIAPDKVLFAGADEGVRPSLSMEGINRLSAKAAFSHVFASRVGERERSYINQIGSGPLLTEEEMIALLREVLSKENAFGDAKRGA